MKTRIIHTKIHFEDTWFNTLSIEYRYLYIYLFTNSHIGLTGIYPLSERVAILETGATSIQWQEGIRLFTIAGKIKCLREWIWVINSKRYSNYSGPKNEEAYKRELASIPLEVLTSLGYPIDTVSYSIDTTINHKSEIINPKSETKNSKLEDWLKKAHDVIGKPKKEEIEPKIEINGDEVPF